MLLMCVSISNQQKYCIVIKMFESIYKQDENPLPRCRESLWMVANSETLLQFEGIPHVAPLLILTACIVIYTSAAHSHDHSVI